MKIGIIGAMEEEITVLANHLEGVEHFSDGGADFISGRYGMHEVVLVRSGIGKVLAAVTTTLLIDRYHVDYLINTGSAGGIGKGLKIGDVVIANRLAYHDVDVTAFGYEPGQMAGMPLYYEADKTLVQRAETASDRVGLDAKVGLIVSGDQFVHSQDQIQCIHHLFPEVLANEMEGTAIAQVAFQFRVPFVVIRAMSDVGDESANVNFDEFIIEAGKKSAEMVMALLDELDEEAVL